MDCRQARGLLMDDLAMTLAPEERDALREHLSGCEACRTEAEVLREAWRALGSLEVVSPPSGVRAKVFQALEAERGREKRILSALRRLLPAPLAAALASLGLALFLPFDRLADLCRSLLESALTRGDLPMSPFLFLAGFAYSFFPLGLALGLLTGKVEPFPGRSATLAGALFSLIALPYVVWECMPLDPGSAVSLASGFVLGTFASTSSRAWVWKVRLREMAT